ncbi:MAG: hypothetical protein JWN20_147 [Jatrophihabitantaceae bacterium]|nr:hypothetical protein [Jatrophihabitantaceae bacterium]
MTSNHGLARFVAAQDAGGTYAAALAELQRGRKSSHWMWFVFPQVAGLGLSSMSQRYAISSLDEARAYVAHPVLGPRLRECAIALLDLPGGTAAQILGGIDAQKLQSSMTLSARAEPGEQRWSRVLDRFFDGAADDGTDRLLRASGS